MNIEMKNEEIELWKMCDVKLNNRLASIFANAYLAKRTGDYSLVYKEFFDLVKRYNEIDIEKLKQFPTTFPIKLIELTRYEIMAIGAILEDYEELCERVDLISNMGYFFSIDGKRYNLYRSKVKEPERKR